MRAACSGSVIEHVSAPAAADDDDDVDDDATASLMFQESNYPFLAVLLPSVNCGTTEVGRLQGWHGRLNCYYFFYFFVIFANFVIRTGF